MTNGPVIFYDHDHCHEFLETHSRELKEKRTGLDALALYRPLFYGFTEEAIETCAITLGQFDAGLVYMFVPGCHHRKISPAAHKVARAKAKELLGCSTPMIFEIKAARKMEPPLGPQAACEKWMKPDLLAMIDDNTIEIYMVINGQAFFDQVLLPCLTQNAFTTPDDYVSAAKSGNVRITHAAAPGKTYRLPWIKWVREMFTGGFNMSYMMACLGTYLQQIHQAVESSNSPTACSTLLAIIESPYLSPCKSSTDGNSIVGTPWISAIDSPGSGSKSGLCSWTVSFTVSFISLRI